MKAIRSILFVLHIFVGFSAVAGGWNAITDPQSPMGMTTDALKNSPFTDFLIPGIILFGLLGIGNFIFAGLFWPWKRSRGYLSNIMGWALMIWIIVQCIMLQAVYFLHVLYFAFGAVQAAFATMILFKEKLFPTNMVLRMLASLRKPKGEAV